MQVLAPTRKVNHDLLLLITLMLFQHPQVFQNCTLSNSSSETGGAVGAWENTSVAIHDSRIEFSKASDLGGGLYFDGNSSSYLSHLLMVNNSAEASGGSLAVFGSAKVCAATHVWRRHFMH